MFNVGLNLLNTDADYSPKSMKKQKMIKIISPIVTPRKTALQANLGDRKKKHYKVAFKMENEYPVKSGQFSQIVPNFDIRNKQINIESNDNTPSVDQYVTGIADNNDFKDELMNGNLIEIDRHL